VCWLVTLAGPIFLSAQTQPSAPHRWVQTSYLDFAGGTLVDGGANDYVSADGSIRLINRWDLNGDGNIDIVLPSSHDGNSAVSSYLYWGGKKFSASQKALLPGDAASGATIADLNNDGLPDIVIANSLNGTKAELRSFIYWNSPQGYSPKKRTDLPTVDAIAVTAGDLDKDGYPDLVFASGGYSYQFNREGGDYTFLRPYSEIYWGSDKGYSPQNVSHLSTFEATDVKIADLNKDGYPDILFAMRGHHGENDGIFIYWGSKDGRFSELNRTFLPGLGTSAVEVADLDKDGFPEVLLANDGKKGGRTQVPVEYPVPSYIYWGSADGYDPAKRTELPTAGACDVKTADLNGDGVADIVFANEVGGASFIYWGLPSRTDSYAPSRRTELPTLNPSRCAVSDLNGDGLPDLIFSNNNDGRTHTVSSFVYWNAKDGFDAKRKLDLPTLGASDLQVADLDNDGRPDILFVNGQTGTAGQPTPTYIYWGNAKSLYTPSARLTLPMSTEAYTAADLNNDGYPDLLLSAQGGLHILWGSVAGYSLRNSTALPGHYIFNVGVADFNHDGYLDISISDLTESPDTDRLAVYWGGPSGFSVDNRWSALFPGIRCHVIADLDGNGYPDIVVTGTRQKAAIFWNGPVGFNADNKTILPTKESITAQVADLNGDGYLDIVIPNIYDYDKLQQPKDPIDISAPAQTAPWNAGTYIYWGGANGYSASDRLVLPTVGGDDVAIADLNRDGYLDLVISSYHAGTVRNHPSYIFWGSAKGFDPANVTMLPTESAALVVVADFNKDGWKDIFFSNHTDGTNHRTNSFLYWGGINGFSVQRRQLIPGVGVHGNTRADIGNIRNRSDEFEYISSSFDAGETARFRSISWEAASTIRPGIKFQVRLARTREALAGATWVGPGGPNTFFVQSGGSLDSCSECHWIQYKATLLSSGGTASPILKSVSVEYTVAPVRTRPNDSDGVARAR
jgi:hypothetical protein